LVDPVVGSGRMHSQPLGGLCGRCALRNQRKKFIFSRSMARLFHAPTLVRRAPRGKPWLVQRLHYQDKDELVAQAVLEGFRIFGSYLMDALEHSTPIRRFRVLGRRYLDFALENPADYRRIFMTDCRE